MLRLSEFDYLLPEDRIAQNPAEPRDSSKLLVLDGGVISHRVFSDLPSLLEPGDLLVLNNTRVTARRLVGQRETGGAVEALLLREAEPLVYEALLKPAKRMKVGAAVRFSGGLRAEIIAEGDHGLRTLKFDSVDGIDNAGSVPLPPYIHSTNAPDERYQTVYAQTHGSSAAPTAGLHFTPELLSRLRDKGIGTAFVTLEVGIDTFRPMQSEDVSEHKMHAERFFISDENRNAVPNATGRVIAVGTASARRLLC